MKRILVALISVLVLAAAGTVLAQTDAQQYESTPQQGTTASDTTSQPGTKLLSQSLRMMRLDRKSMSQRRPPRGQELAFISRPSDMPANQN